ncbi:MAG: hypothetical protein E7477_06335, partial [Ruminococcaceae bacterium]|nr:hypothetical protein [Oscillospiraceae bacterium]
MTKKILSLILLSCMVFSICACAQEEPEVVPDYTTELDSVDFMGADFIFLQRNDEHSSGENYFGYVSETEFADLALKRVEEVEDKYNIKITVHTDKDINSTVQNETYAGAVSADAVQESSGGINGLSRAGLLHGLSDLSDYIDFTDFKKWGTLENLKPFFWDNEIYAVTPAAWPMLKYRSMDGPMIV